MNQFPYLYPHSLSEAERLNEEELWQDSVGKTAIVNVDPPSFPSPAQTGPVRNTSDRPVSFSPHLLAGSSADQFFSEAEWTAFLNCSGVCPVIFLNTT